MAMNILTEIRESLLHLAFPHVCAGCGSDRVGPSHPICLACLSALPKTDFHLYKENPADKIFWGRLSISRATAHYYFTKKSVLQQLLHDFKYRGNKDLGYFLGRLMGQDLKQSHWAGTIDAIVPLPLFESKEKQRGYNQAEVLAKGISHELQYPVIKNAIVRKQYTESQTRKNRVERWQNMDGRFELAVPNDIAGKHILLVDDVVTTGATLEACGRELLKAPNVQLSIATLCFSLG